jgi:hypothetical protein
VSGMFVVFRCVIANFGPQHIRVSRNAQQDLDGRNKSGLRQAAIIKRPCGSQIDSSSSIPFGRKCKMGLLVSPKLSA